MRNANGWPSFPAIAVMAATLSWQPCAEAAYVQLTMTSNSVTPWTGVANPSTSSAEIWGYDGSLVNGSYQGSALAFTLVSGTAVYDSTGVAGAKIEWDVDLHSDTPVNLFLDVDTSLDTTEEQLFLLGDVYDRSEFTFDLSLEIPFLPGVSILFPLLHEDEIFDTDGQQLTTTYESFPGPTSGNFLLTGSFQVASAYDIYGPGAASGTAKGYLDFRLWADAPSPGGATPESGVIWLVGSGLLGLIGMRKLQIGASQWRHRSR